MKPYQSPVCMLYRPSKTIKRLNFDSSKLYRTMNTTDHTLTSAWAQNEIYILHNKVNSVFQQMN